MDITFKEVPEGAMFIYREKYYIKIEGVKPGYNASSTNGDVADYKELINLSDDTIVIIPLI